MPNINLAPFPYNAEQQAIDRRRQLAMALQQQSMQPIEEPQVPGANASWTQGAAKLVQALLGNYQNSKLDQQQKGLDTRVQSGRQAAIQQMAQAMNIPPTQTQNIETPGGTLPVTLPPPPDAEQNRNQALMENMVSGDPVRQQLAAMLHGQTAEAQRTAQQQQFEAYQKSLDRGLTQQQITNAQQNYLSEAMHRTAQEALAQANEQKPKTVIIPENGQLATVGPDGKITPGLTAPPKPLEPKTVTLNNGIFTLNPDGSLGRRLGDRPTADKQDASEADIVNLAALALKDPEQLKLMDKKTAEKVLARVQASGQTLPNPKKDMQNAMVDKALETVNTMETHPGMWGAVGVKGPSSLFGATSEPLAGTNAAGFVDQFNALKGQITLPNLEMLRGLGRVTDREFQALTTSMTALNRNMPLDEFKKELGKVKTTLKTIQDRNAGGQPGAPAAPTPNVIHYDANGNRTP